MGHLLKMLLCGAALAALSACGSGGGGGVAFVPPAPPTPTPRPTPTPTPTPAEAANVKIFDSPATQEFAVMGGPETFRIRYDAAAKAYEVSNDVADWRPLLPGFQANYYETEPGGTWLSVDQVYGYSALAEASYWRIAVGSATAPERAPSSGSATYQGVIAGDSDTFDNGPFPWPNPVAGTIALSFDFGAGTLSGSMHPILYMRDGPSPTSQDLGVLAFKDTVYSAGGTGFSGAFDTNVAGPNNFAGRFTGPNAEELIGTWAVPFIWNSDNQPHWAEGAMIAKH